MNGMGKRLRLLRGNRKQSEVAAEISSRYQQMASSSYAMYENDQREPNYITLIALADYYDVSTDFLLGRSECSSTNKDIQYACSTTGLSEEAITKLSKYKEEIAHGFNYGKGKLLLIDNFIKSEQLINLIVRILYYAKAKARASLYENNLDTELQYIDALKDTQEKYGYFFSVHTPIDDLNVEEYNLSQFGSRMMEEYKGISEKVFSVCFGMPVEQFLRENFPTTNEKKVE